MNDTALVQLDRAQTALAECRTAMEAKHIADVAEAARVYLERTNASTETVTRATEIRLLAERQMGAFLKAMPKATGARMNGGDSTGKPVVTEGNRRETLAEIGITKKQSARSQTLAEFSDQEFAERVAVAKASGGKLSTARVVSLHPKAKAAGDEADGDSEQLWKLKSIWNKTTKRDRAAFLAWTQHTTT